MRVEDGLYHSLNHDRLSIRGDAGEEARTHSLLDNGQLSRLHQKVNGLCHFPSRNQAIRSVLYCRSKHRKITAQDRVI